MNEDLVKKIKKQRRELKNLGKAHQWLWDKVKIRDNSIKDLLDQLTRAAHRQAKMGEEIRQLKGWNLKEYHLWLVSLDGRV